MIRNIATASVNTTAVKTPIKISKFQPDAILFDVKIGGTGYTPELLKEHKLNATFRTEKSDDVNNIDGLNMYHIFCLSDVLGGQSVVLEGDSVTRISALIPIGNLILDGEDVVDLSLELGGHSTATFEYNIDMIDVVQEPEKIIGYEAVDGNGTEILFKNVSDVYIFGIPSGKSISVQDHEGSYYISDYSAVALLNASKETEKRISDMGIIYQDSLGITQDVRVKVPTGFTALAVKQYFQKDRIGTKNAELARRRQNIADAVKNTNREKYDFLKMNGLV